MVCIDSIIESGKARQPSCRPIRLPTGGLSWESWTDVDILWGHGRARYDLNLVRDNRGVYPSYIWWLENPRLIRPFDVHASAAFFYVRDEVAMLPNDRESYEEFILPQARAGDPDEASYFLDACFGDREALRYAFGDDVEDWL